MTPKEKANDLIRRFYSIGAIECKQCALIAIDELILTLQCGIICIDVERKSHLDLIDYWQDVKKEIELL